MPKDISWSDYFSFRSSQRKRPLPKTHGIWCSWCRTIHPYNGQHRLGIDYQQEEGLLVILWLCPRTYSVLSEARYAP